MYVCTIIIINAVFVVGFLGPPPLPMNLMLPVVPEPLMVVDQQKRQQMQMQQEVLSVSALNFSFLVAIQASGDSTFTCPDLFLLARINFLKNPTILQQIIRENIQVVTMNYAYDGSQTMHMLNEIIGIGLYNSRLYNSPTNKDACVHQTLSTGITDTTPSSPHPISMKS